jgi:hypothetical protein
MFSKIYPAYYTTYYSVPSPSGSFSSSSDSPAMNPSLNLLMIVLPFLIVIGVSFFHDRALHQGMRQASAIEHQREILEQIWKMPARK